MDFSNEELTENNSDKTTDNTFEETKNEVSNNEDLKNDEIQNTRNQEEKEELNNEILKQMDIIPPIQTTEKLTKSSNEITNKLEQRMVSDVEKIHKLQQLGFIDSAQEQNLKKLILKEAFDKLVEQEKIKVNSAQKIKEEKDLIFSNFRNQNPNFFASSGRKKLLNYLQEDGISLRSEDLNKISEIVRILEKTAIEDYLKKAVHEKNLNLSNENAKKKLSANAQNSSSSINLSQTFSREQIGRMTCSEFAKNEKSIMEQLRKGLIK